jgi:sorting nexin-4
MGSSCTTSTLKNDELILSQNVKMHQHIAHPPGPDAVPTLLDNISDTLLNAFARVRKPDERFVHMKDAMDKFEETLNGIERTWGRGRARTSGR